MDEKTKVNEIPGHIETDPDKILDKNGRVNAFLDKWIKDNPHLSLSMAIKISDMECAKDEWIYYAIWQLTGKSIEEVYYWPISAVLRVNEWLSQQLDKESSDIAEGLFSYDGRNFIFHKDAGEIPVNDYILAEESQTKNKNETDKISHLLCAFFTETDDRGNPINSRGTLTWLEKVQWFKDSVPYHIIKPYQLFFLNSWKSYNALTETRSILAEHQAEVINILEKLPESEVQDLKSLILWMETLKKRSSTWPTLLKNGFIGVGCYFYFLMRIIKTWKTECEKTNKWVWNPVSFFKFIKNYFKNLENLQNTEWNHIGWHPHFWEKYYILLEDKLNKIKKL